MNRFRFLLCVCVCMCVYSWSPMLWKYDQVRVLKERSLTRRLDLEKKRKSIKRYSSWLIWEASPLHSLSPGLWRQMNNRVSYLQGAGGVEKGWERGNLLTFFHWCLFMILCHVVPSLLPTGQVYYSHLSFYLLKKKKKDTQHGYLKF